jgi:N-sulfoglucosamine sulfohydrolase
MKASTDPAVAARVDFFLHRTPEEFYDFRADPNALANLIAEPKFASDLAAMRRRMREWMERTGDPLAKTFVERMQK